MLIMFALEVPPFAFPLSRQQILSRQRLGEKLSVHKVRYVSYEIVTSQYDVDVAYSRPGARRRIFTHTLLRAYFRARR